METPRVIDKRFNDLMNCECGNKLNAWRKQDDFEGYHLVSYCDDCRVLITFRGHVGWDFYENESKPLYMRTYREWLTVQPDMYLLDGQRWVGMVI